MPTNNPPADTIRELVSVIIPCFNRKKFLEEAIRSVLNQTYREFEMIVVDDGSTDNSAEVARSYPTVMCLQQTNRGVSDARNNGFRHSKGEFVLFLDSDDRLLPDALEFSARSLRNNPESGFVSGHVRLINSDGDVVSIPEKSCIEKDHYVSLLRSNYIWTPSSVLFRSSVFRSRGGFRRSLSAGADWDIYLRIAQTHAVHCHDSLVAEYRVHEQSMNTNRALMLSDSIRALKLQRSMIRQNNLYGKAYRDGIAGIQKYYGDPLIDDVRGFRRNREWLRLGKGVLTLLHYHPRAFFRR